MQKDVLEKLAECLLLAQVLLPLYSLVNPYIDTCTVVVPISWFYIGHVPQEALDFRIEVNHTF